MKSNVDFKKNLGALTILVILLLTIYSVIYELINPEVALVILVGLSLSLYGLKSYTGIKAKNIEATMEGSNGNQGTDK